MSTDAPEELFADDDGVLYAEEVTPQHGVVGFTLRELIIVGAWVVLFVTSFFPVGWAPTLWTQGVTWLLPLGVPTAAVFLIVLRRFSPEGIRRVGSLGIDQFASVAFSVAAVWWVQVIWEYLTSVIGAGPSFVVWVPWVQLAALLTLVVTTVFAPLIPGLREDFHGRIVTLAHRNANPVRPVIERPRPERAAPDAATADETTDAGAADDEVMDESTDDVVERLGLGGSIPLSAHASGGEPGSAADIGDDYVPGYARSSRGVESDERPVADNPIAEDPADEEPAAAVHAQPFWALAPTVRDVHDEHGQVLFQIGPDAWALVIEDRGGAFVIRHDDGRIGYLHETDDITKG